jgi:phospholipid/cholesterol/gamma-HCH transport system substrate-binding protein
MKQVIKVGIFATLCLLILAVLIWKIEDWNPFTHAGKHTIAASFASVAGLDDKAAVRVAGVRVGKVSGIHLAPDGRSARVGLLLDQPIGLTAGARARIANLGLLGDKYVEIIPGPPDAPPLPPGAVLPGSTPISIDDAMAKLDNIGSSIEKVTGSFGGQKVGDNINSLVKDLQMTSEEIRALVAENRASVSSTLRNADAVSATLAHELPRLSSQMQRALDQIEQVIAENRPDVQASMGNIKEITGRLQTSVDNLNKITGDVAEGRGTVGKLITSDEAYNHALSTLDSIKSGVDTLGGTIGAIQRFRLDLGLEGFLLGHQANTFSSSHSSFGVIIDPSDNLHLYKAALVSTPSGSFSIRRDTITTRHNDGTVTVRTTEDDTSRNNLQWTAMLGLHGPSGLRLWGGLVEGRGGVQGEFPFTVWHRPLWASMEAFDFSRPNKLRPHVRLSGRYHVSPSLYFISGVDDVIENKAFFFGAGITWRDDNLKYLLGALPRL